MTYYTVFDISERFAGVVIGVVALGCLGILVALSLRRDWRSLLRRTSWLWLGGAGLPWFLFGVHDIGGQYGLLFGGVGAGIALFLAAFACQDLELPMQDGTGVPARSVVPFAVAFLLLVPGFMGCWQSSAFDLSRRLAAGNVSVVAGTVEDADGGNWALECFTVDAHQFCYDSGPSSVGFHQSANNGGQIHNGLQVRVTSIGDVIVRLEIAGGQ
jgi:hypothetical protein